MILLLLQAIIPLALAACPEHPAPQHGDLAPSPWQEGAIVIRCHYGLVPLGAGAAFCEGEAWSEELECGEAVALLLGGDEEDGYSYRAELFPPTGCREVPHLPQPVHGGAAAWVGGMVVVCGGEPQPFAMTTECFGYSVEDNLWLELPGLSSPRSMLSGVVMDGALVVTGGYDKDYYGTDISEVWVPGRGLESPWEPLPSLPHTRSDHCSVSIGDSSGLAVVVTGNYPEVPSDNMAETSTLTVDSLGGPVWTPGADMAQGRDEHGCSQVSFDGGATVEVMVAGGPNTAKAEIYDPTSNSWRSAAPLPHATFGPGMAVVDGRPTVMGGYQKDAEPRNQDRVLVYHTETNSWAELPAKLQARRHAILTVPVPRSLFCTE